MKKRLVVTLVLMVCIALPVMAQHFEGTKSIGLFGSAAKLVGDNRDDAMIWPWFGLKLGYTPEPRLTFTLSGAYGASYAFDKNKSGVMKYITKMPDTPFETSLIPIMGDVQVNFKPECKLNPYLTWGIGVLIWDLKKDGTSVDKSHLKALGDFGAGIEWFLSESIGLDLSGHYQHILRQELDMSGYGDVQTGNLEARLGLNFYFGGNKDTDGDGILNARDKCPKEAEDIDGFQDEDGCPDLDNDGDGIADAKDKAPNMAEDKDGFQDEDGIPDLDNDGDGIPDAKDKAPAEAEDKDGYQDEDGVPDLDNDGDGIPDAKDKCPDQPETVNGFEDADGCTDKKPEVVIVKEAPIVLEGVTFQTGSSTLTAGAKTVLDKVVKTLVDYPQMVLEVGGHTDNVGSRASNVKLSQKRADAVKTYLVSKGIAATRIQAKGYGPDKPIVPNTDAAGRNRNRRIEFMRLD